MPQVRDPKTGRYTSGGGSSVGGAAAVNPRVAKAANVGSGATVGGSNSAIKSQKNISYDNAEKMFNAPQGTVLELSHHSSGDYVGEYTRTADGWAGSQKYRSSYAAPGKVKTAKGFAMQIVGMDVTVK